jgi:hypothetical protein
MSIRFSNNTPERHKQRINEPVIQEKHLPQPHVAFLEMFLRLAKRAKRETPTIFEFAASNSKDLNNKI